MANINPVSDISNCNSVLESMSVDSPVYPIVNDRGKNNIRDIAEDDEFEKTRAMLRLMCELNEGRRTGEEEGYVSADAVRIHFSDKGQD